MKYWRIFKESGAKIQETTEAVMKQKFNMALFNKDAPGQTGFCYYACKYALLIPIEKDLNRK